MTLQTIRNSVRNIVAMPSPNQISDALLNDFIDRFYIQDFPEVLKTLELEGWLRIQLQPNIDRYSLGSGFLSSGRNLNSEIAVASVDQIYGVVKPAYIDGYEVSWNQDPQYFYRTWPDNKFIETASTGTGVTGPYTFTLTNLPVERGSVIISADSQSTRDNGVGGWQATSYAGTINYTTGAVSITFPIAVPTGTSIEAHYYPYVASRPRDVLFFEQYFVFRPIPDRAYEFRVKSLRRPTAMANPADAPEFTEWNDFIAYGTALKIFVENGDWDEVNNLMPIFERQKLLAQRRAIKQMKNQRAATPYDSSDLTNGAYWPIYPIY